jgi:hypothetical protein
MNEYLIYKIFTTALIASILIYWKLKSKSSDTSYSQPKETDDGKFAIPKPADEDMEGIDCEEIRTDPKFKENAQSLSARIPDPKGTPTVRP